MGRVIGLDPGSKRIGVAISDSSRTMAFPRPSVPVGEAAWAALESLVVDEEADLVVVGRPVALAGHDTPSTQQADSFREQLIQRIAPVPVVALDERLTTVSASRQLSSAGVRSRDQRQVVDSAAATVLLQGFLDRHDA